MTDQEIVALYWQRSEEAVRQSQARYGSYCLAVAGRILASRQDAEECVNDTWLAAWNAMPTQRPALLRPFLARITRNLACDRSDYNHAQKRSPELTVVLEELADCVSGWETVESEYEAQRLREVINRFLRAQDEDDCALFLRRYWFAEPIARLCRRYDLGESAVKSRLFRLRKRLRAFLEEEGIEV